MFTNFKQGAKNFLFAPLQFCLFLSALSLVIHRWLHSLGNGGVVLGLMGTGDWATGQEPENWRESILLLFPNTPAALTALMTKLKTETTNDPKFHIFTKSLPNQRVLVSGTHASGVTQISLQGTTPAKVLKKGHTLMNERTLERVWVVADSSGAYTAIDVSRGMGSTAAQMNDGDGLIVVGSHHQDGAATPTAIAYTPTESENYVQDFRTSLAITNVARATFLRTGPQLIESQRESLELHAIEREMGYIFGTGVLDTSGAQPERTTKGFISLVTSNVTDFAGAFDIDTWESFLEDVFEDGSNEKLLLAGNTALTNINKVGRVHGEIKMAPTDESYGMRLHRYITPYGDLLIRQHPLFSKNPTFRSWGIVVDTTYLVDRILSGNGLNFDTQYLENRQAPGTTQTVDEWETISGLELQHQSPMGVVKGISGFVPAILLALGGLMQAMLSLGNLAS